MRFSLSFMAESCAPRMKVLFFLFTLFPASVFSADCHRKPYRYELTDWRSLRVQVDSVPNTSTKEYEIGLQLLPPKSQAKMTFKDYLKASMRHMYYCTSRLVVQSAGEYDTPIYKTKWNNVNQRGQVAECTHLTYHIIAQGSNLGPEDWYPSLTKQIIAGLNASNPPEVSVQVDNDFGSAELLVQAQCNETEEYDLKYEVDCEQEEKWSKNYTDSNITLGDLFPNKNYTCHAKVHYPDGSQTPDAEFSFTRVHNFSLTSLGPDLIRVDLQNLGSLQFDYHVEYEYYPSENPSSPSRLVPRNRQEAIDGLAPFTEYVVCLTIAKENDLSVKDGTNEMSKICQTIRTLEAQPQGAPTVSLMEDYLFSDSFRVTLNPPPAPHGIILRYELALFRRQCNECDPANYDATCDHFTHVENVTALAQPPGETTTYEFSDLWTYATYKVLASAFNSVGGSSVTGDSKEDHIFRVTTRPTLQGYVAYFDLESGDSYIYIKARTPCPYNGRQKYLYKLYRTPGGLEKDDDLIYDLPKNQSELSVKFTGLQNGQKYRACLQILSINQDPECTNKCANYQRCLPAETKCVPIPNPERSLGQVNWTPKDGAQFNPFKQIKIVLKKNTFNGSQSGISSYRLECEEQKGTQMTTTSPRRQLITSNSSMVNWNKDSFMYMSNLSPSFECRMTMTAFGCQGHNMSTPPETMRTSEYRPASFQIEYEEHQDELDRKNTNEDGHQFILVKLVEEKVNIMHAPIDEYQFGTASFKLEDLFDRASGEITRQHCLDHSQSYPDRTVCYLLLPIDPDQTTVELAIASQFTAQPNVQVVEIEFAQPWLLIALSLVLLLTMLTMVILATHWWRTKPPAWVPTKLRKDDRQISRPASSSRDPSAAVPMVAHQAQVPAAYSRRLSLPELSAWVREASFNPESEYYRLNDLDQRTIVLQQSTSEARKWNRDRLNRYGNILPYDNKRVVLREPIHGCDYINASWVRGHEGRQFIACQGPLENTMEHFWRMVVENRVTLVVMLTKLKEMNSARELITKCHEYWPSRRKALSFDDMSIVCVKEHKAGVDLTIRKFKLHQKGHPDLQVTQLHYTGWPDHGVPDNPQQLLRFYEVFRRHCSPSPAHGHAHSHAHGQSSSAKTGTLPKQQSPIIIHCSAGVGRTGTLIGLDTIVRKIEQNEVIVDVFNVVLQMRQDRRFMVQKAVQYSYLYQCIGTYIRAHRLDEEDNKVSTSEEHREQDEEYIYELE